MARCASCRHRAVIAQGTPRGLAAGRSGAYDAPTRRGAKRRTLSSTFEIISAMAWAPPAGVRAARRRRHRHFPRLFDPAPNSLTWCCCAAALGASGRGSQLDSGALRSAPPQRAKQRAALPLFPPLSRAEELARRPLGFILFCRRSIGKKDAPKRRERATYPYSRYRPRCVAPRPTRPRISRSRFGARMKGRAPGGGSSVVYNRSPRPTCVPEALLELVSLTGKLEVLGVLLTRPGDFSLSSVSL